MSTIRTSATHPLRVGWLPTPWLGKVGLTFAPGKKQLEAATGAWQRDLATDIRRLRDEFSADHLVCLVEDSELKELQIEGLGSAAHAGRASSLCRSRPLPPLRCSRSHWPAALPPGQSPSWP